LPKMANKLTFLSDTMVLGNSRSLTTWSKKKAVTQDASEVLEHGMK